MLEIPDYSKFEKHREEMSQEKLKLINEKSQEIFDLAMGNISLELEDS